jgi:hypothetical protein
MFSITFTSSGTTTVLYTITALNLTVEENGPAQTQSPIGTSRQSAQLQVGWKCLSIIFLVQQDFFRFLLNFSVNINILQFYA